MRWTPGGESSDIEDRRDSGGGGSGFGGGGGGMRIGVGGLIVLGLLSLVFKRDLISPFLGVSNDAPVSRGADPAQDAKEKPLVEFVSFVLDDNQKTWAQIFSMEGREYRKTRLVLFRDATQSGCGAAESATG